MSTPRVLVYGDLMLDMMVTGSQTRMSPEVPTAPVVLAHETTWRPGGAANVAANVTTIGGEAVLIGAIGRDADAYMLTTLLQSEVKETFYLMRENVRTTTKVRIFANGKQMLRVDCEEPAPLTDSESKEVLETLMVQLDAVAAVVISDYAKGMVTASIAKALIMAARDRGIPVVVDTKTPAEPQFNNAGVLKPNLAEIASALGRPEPATDKEAAASAIELRRRTGALFVALTRGSDGMCLVGEPGVRHIPAHKVNVVDVTGAGDAVAAGFAVALAHGVRIDDAARYANAAGAAVVTRLGTCGPTPEEVRFFYDDRNSHKHRADHHQMESCAEPSRFH